MPKGIPEVEQNGDKIFYSKLKHIRKQINPGRQVYHKSNLEIMRDDVKELRQ
jgi:hypothetical protein